MNTPFLSRKKRSEVGGALPEHFFRFLETIVESEYFERRLSDEPELSVEAEDRDFPCHLLARFRELQFRKDLFDPLGTLLERLEAPKTLF